MRFGQKTSPLSCRSISQMNRSQHWYFFRSFIKDHTLGSGLRCSVKNCLNSLSKNLSFFGIPKDSTMSKKWMEKCGITKDPAKKLISATRVCSTHFELDCFRNPKLKKRLKPGAVLSLF